MSRFVLPVASVGEGISPFDGAKLYFYATGTSTFQDTYSDVDMTIPNSNPVEADANGFFPDIYIASSYKVVLKDKNGVQKYEWDPVDGSISTDTVSVSFYQQSDFEQEDLPTDSTYTWGNGDLSDSAKAFTIGLQKVSLSNPNGYSSYFDETPLAVPGTDSDPTSGVLFNFGTGTVTMHNGATVDNHHTLFSNNTIHLPGMTSTSGPGLLNNAYISITGAGSSLDVNTTDADFTYQQWIYFDTLPTTFNEDLRLFQDGNASGHNLNFGISYDGVTLSVGVGDGNDTSVGSVSFGWSASTGQWYFLEITRASTLVRFFVNGVQQGSASALTSTNQYNVISTKTLCSRIVDDGPGVLPANANTITSVLNGSAAYARFINGTALHTSSYTPPAAPSVFNGAGGSFALRIITDQGELTDNVYSGYGTNLTSDDWSAAFSTNLSGNTYIGVCDNIPSTTGYYTGTVDITRGADLGAGVYLWNVKVNGYIEDPALDGTTEVSSVGYFATDELPIGFKLYTIDLNNVEFDDGIATLSQYAQTGNLSVSTDPEVLAEYGNEGDFYLNTGDADDLVLELPVAPDVVNRTAYPPLNGTTYLAGTKARYKASGDNTGPMTAKLGTGPILDVVDRNGDPIEPGTVTDGTFATINYDYENDNWELNTLEIPDNTITHDMMTDNSVGTAEIINESITSSKMAAGVLPTVYTSAYQNFVKNTTLTYAHGLGEIPTITSVLLRNINAEYGYVPGDTLLMTDAIETGPSGTASYGCTIQIDSTNVTVIIGQDGYDLIRKDNKDSDHISDNDWEVGVVAVLV